MEKRYGIPWFKISFIGAEATAKSLRKIAAYFGAPELVKKVEKVIAEEIYHVEAVRQEVEARCKGKTAMLFVGGSRAHHYQELFAEIGMKTVSAGYEFAHRDDYEGRKVLPNIVVDADTRNIEELTVEADPSRYRPRRSEEELQQLEKQMGIGFNDYVGMMAEMKKGDLIIDDINHHEAEVLMENTSRISSAPASRRSTSSKKAAYRSSSFTVMTTAAPTPDSAAPSTFTGR